MNLTHKASRKFWRYYALLPEEIQRQAKKQYRLLRENPLHPSLHLKKIGAHDWSVRVNSNYRAIGQPIEGGFLWIWIGSHKDYEAFYH